MYLRQPAYAYSVYILLTKKQTRTQKFKATEYLRFNYRNEIDKACFQHEMMYQDVNDLPKKTKQKNGVWQSIKWQGICNCY